MWRIAVRSWGCGLISMRRSKCALFLECWDFKGMMADEVWCIVAFIARRATLKRRSRISIGLCPRAERVRSII